MFRFNRPFVFLPPGIFATRGADAYKKQAVAGKVNIIFYHSPVFAAGIGASR